MDDWTREYGDPLEDEEKHIRPVTWSETKRYEHVTTEGNIRWTKGEILLLVFLLLSIAYFVGRAIFRF